MEYISSKKDVNNLTITIYNDNFGAIKEKRSMSLLGKEEYVQFLDVAQTIETDSLLVEGLEVIEFNFDYDLVDKAKLLEKYLDNMVYLFDRSQNKRTEFRLLSIHGGIILENMETKEIVINPSDELILPKLPNGLVIKPALIWKIKPTTAKEVSISYLAGGLSWTSNYVVELKDKTLNMTGWVNIENASGTTYECAKLKLIAGDVKRIQRETRDYDSDMMVYECTPSPAENFSEKSFFDYHMYTLKNLTTLKNSQSKQINFINCSNIGYRKYYEFSYINYDNKPKIIIELDNKNENGLGIPLPKGIVKVYKEDPTDNSLEFVGEESIDHTSKDEKVKLHIGDAFDVRCHGKQTDCQKQDGYIFEEYEYEIRNHKPEEIEAEVSHYIRGEWEMVTTNHEYYKRNANDVVFKVKVPADKGKTIKLRYKIDCSIEIGIRSKQ